MNGVDRIYKLAFRKNFTNFEGNFPLSKNLILGDYGVMRNGYFSRIGNVNDPEIGITFQKRLDANPTHEIFRSQNDIGVESIAKGEINESGVVALKAELDISFSSSNAIFFSSANVLYSEIEDIALLGSQILALYKADKWKKEFFIITRLIEGKNTIILISGSSSCRVSIDVTADVPEIDLANGGLDLSIKNSYQTSYDIIAPDTSQLGIGFSRIYDNIFIKPTFQTTANNAELFASLDNNGNKVQVVFGDVIPQSYDTELS